VWADARELEDVPAHLLKELEHFFSVYKDLEEKKTAALGWRPAAEAFEIIEAARAAAH